MQRRSKVPMFIGMDLEWGLNMRLDSTVRFPAPMVTLGAMQGNDALIEKMGSGTAQQCKRMGIHIDYAPVVDVNNNPNNPVINFRSFGENRRSSHLKKPSPTCAVCKKEASSHPPNISPDTATQAQIPIMIFPCWRIVDSDWIDLELLSV
jgi:hypothetical protein